MKLFRILMNSIIFTLLVVVLGFCGFLAWATFTDYKPEAFIKLPVKEEGLPSSGIGDTIRLFTWNIGYAGLGSDMDFFYEGGKRVRPSLIEYERYMNGIGESLVRADHPDFVFLQEVDWKSKRSYYVNEVAFIDSLFAGYSCVFASNYDVGFVPIPPSEPMGRVKAGLITLGRYCPEDASRIAFPSSYTWPKRLFMLDRCFLITRYNLNAGKELVLINTHNSAFDDAAGMRKKELMLLQKTMLDEYALGNFVIVGGDWNQNPLPFDPASVLDSSKVHSITPPIPGDFIPADWKWAFDPERPTNRDVNEPYVKGHTGTTIIDFFVLSPNINLLEVKTIPQGFLFSDHQAVKMKVSFQR